MLKVLQKARRKIYVAVREGEMSDEEEEDPRRLLQFASDAASSIEERCSGCSAPNDSCRSQQGSESSARSVHEPAVGEASRSRPSDEVRVRVALTTCDDAM